MKGDATDSWMKDNLVDRTRLVKRIMDNVEYNFFNLKELDYTSKIMSIYGCLTEEEDETSQRINSSSEKSTLDPPKYLIITLHADTL